METNKSLRIETLLEEVINKNASDMHLQVGLPPTLRVDGKLTPAAHSEVLNEEAVEEADSFVNENKDVFKSQGTEVVTLGNKSYLLDEKILSAYSEKGLLEKVDAALRAGISSTRDGDKAILYYKQLVGTYMKANRNDKAADIVRELIQAFPNHAENALWKQGLAELRAMKK